jgi:hypothetical protein
MGDLWLAAFPGYSASAQMTAVPNGKRRLFHPYHDALELILAWESPSYRSIGTAIIAMNIRGREGKRNACWCHPGKHFRNPT